MKYLNVFVLFSFPSWPIYQGKKILIRKIISQIRTSSFPLLSQSWRTLSRYVEPPLVIAAHCGSFAAVLVLLRPESLVSSVSAIFGRLFLIRHLGGYRWVLSNSTRILSETFSYASKWLRDSDFIQTNIKVYLCILCWNFIDFSLLQ